MSLLLGIAALSGAFALTAFNQASAAPGEANFGVIRNPLPLAATLPPASCTLTGTVRACDLWATTGTINVPGLATPINIWGYSTTQTSAATLPGPTIIANQGETLQITLHNTLPYITSLSLPMMLGAPDLNGIGAGNVTPTSKTYTFNNLKPGTSLYEAGLAKGANGNVQVAMGMFGGLIVRPTGQPLQAYDANSTFTDEALLVFSDIDPALNAAPTTFDLHTYAPKYWLINGQAYPNTATISSAAGNNVLLRYLNAGLRDHAIGTMGLHSWVYGVDGKALKYPYQVVVETIASGQSMDLITTIPATAPAGSNFALYNAANHLDNSGARTSTTVATSPIKYGGMLTFINVSGTPSGGTSGPVVSNATVNPSTANGSVNVVLSASIAPAFASAEYFIDTIGTNGAGIAMNTTGCPTGANACATITTATLATLSNGNHTFYIHALGTGTTGVYGGFGSATLNLSKTGPVVSGTVLPTPANGSVDVNINVHADSTSTSNLNVTAGEYFLDPVGTPATTTRGTALTLGPAGAAPITTLTGAIPAATVTALSNGTHTVAVRAQDANGSWGNFANITVTVDKIGPTTSAVTALPSPNNGTVMFDPNTPFKVTATVSDTAGGNSNIVAAEAYVDNTTNPAASIPMLPVTGFNFGSSASVNVYITIALNDIKQLGQGQHTLFVRGQDAAGNWSAFASKTFIVDVTSPTVTGLTATAVTNRRIRLNFTATDPVNTAKAPATVSAPASNIVAAEYFEGTDPGAGKGTAITLPAAGTTSKTVSFTTTQQFSRGTHTLYIRVKDAAGNWSVVYSVRVTV